ncbi:hypothetical protein [Streptomyces sp. SID3343]|uniref:hypothetical protein n=1 Tax=Streptomyces sp. SID3343 TaxID=2690260 RepID=UPI00136C5A50|nr:hypothetical protein [Streptomyces sp. SID3343]MYW02871.1 hypothetical protein [Streptomyces sp. SID3343]
MNTPTRIAVYVGSLAVAFGAATGVGYAVGPFDDDKPSGHTSHGADPTAKSGVTNAPAAPGTPAGADLPPGLQAVQGGWALRLLTESARAGEATQLRFRIVGTDGAPLRGYTEQHEKELHLIVVRRDLAGYQHLHPVRDAEGVWSAPFTAAEAGSYKVFADFRPVGAAAGFTLASDLPVSGSQTPAPPLAATRTAQVDGYTVELGGSLAAGASTALSFAISRDGVPVDGVEPYLGARGHLVALREGDLAYLHVHPEDGAGDRVAFRAEAPTGGEYRLFFEFKRDGVVHAAQFRVTADGAAAPGAPAGSEPTKTQPAPEPAGGHEH